MLPTLNLRFPLLPGPNVLTCNCTSYHFHPPNRITLDIEHWRALGGSARLLWTAALGRLKCKEGARTLSAWFWPFFPKANFSLSHSLSFSVCHIRSFPIRLCLSHSLFLNLYVSLKFTLFPLPSVSFSFICSLSVYPSLSLPLSVFDCLNISDPICLRLYHSLC